MEIGTYTRTTALDILIDAFLSHPPSPLEARTTKKQIISLGAGTDTRYLRLRAQRRTQNLLYHEFDFPSVCEAKYSILKRNPGLLPDITPTPAISEGGNSEGWQVSGGEDAGYFLHPLDLRNLPSMPNLEAFLGLEADVPTLIISECCLCYLTVGAAGDVIEWFTSRIPDLGIVLYEPIGVDDAFGQMMVENLAARGVVMPTLQAYKSLGDQKQRLRIAGFGAENDRKGGVRAVTVEEAWDQWIAREERERVDALEGLDEVEEWQMLARHYAVVWGWRGEGWKGWEEFEPGESKGGDLTPKHG